MLRQFTVKLAAEWSWASIIDTASDHSTTSVSVMVRRSFENLFLSPWLQKRSFNNVGPPLLNCKRISWRGTSQFLFDHSIISVPVLNCWSIKRAIIQKLRLQNWFYERSCHNVGFDNASHGSARRKIRLIEDKAKCRHLLPVKGLCGRCISVWGQNPIPPPLHIVYVYTVYTTYSHREGGRIEPERRLEGHQFTKLGRKYQHDWLYLQSINSDKHLPQSPFIGQLF